MRVDIDEELKQEKNEQTKDSSKKTEQKNTKDATLGEVAEMKKAEKNKEAKKSEKQAEESPKDSEKGAKTKQDSKKEETKTPKEDQKAPKESSKKSTAPKTTPATKPKNAKTIKVNVLDEDDVKPKTAKKSEMKLPVVRKIHVRIGYFVFAVLLILAGTFFTKVAIWENNYLAAKEGSERAKPESHSETFYETVEGEEIDETKPTEHEIQAYTVAPEKPRFLTIPAVRIYNARITEIGVRANGELSTPSNIYNIGWYTGSSPPGERGTSVMDAHGGSQGVGVFKDLPKLKAGDTITVEMGDGRLFNYRVADVVTKQLGDEANDYMSTAFSSPQGNTPSLTLITCTGEWSQRLQTYMQRLFVRAVLEQYTQRVKIVYNPQQNPKNYGFLGFTYGSFRDRMKK